MRSSLVLPVAAFALVVDGVSSPAQRTRADTTPTIELSGFAQTDAIYDFRVNNPEWFDVNRPTQLPAFAGEFGRNGHTWMSVRQTRLGITATIPTPRSNVETTFEWDLFGVGPTAGQTTFQLLLAYGQWGKLGAGQLPSPFMDYDVFPDILDYWGPNGMIFFRNVQIFWQPIKRDDGTRLTLALERPGASGDRGIYANRVELEGIRAHFPVPDVSGEYRLGTKWGYVEIAGVARWIRWNDLRDDALDLGGGVTGWGWSLSSNVNASSHDVLKLQLSYGAGVENYFNDAPVDVGPEAHTGDPRRPVRGVALPDFGLVAFLDHRWTAVLTSSIGYSRVDIRNSDAQTADAFRSGQYAVANLLYYPVAPIMTGAELQWARRSDFRSGFSANDVRLQFSFRYSYSQKFGGREAQSP